MMLSGVGTASSAHGYHSGVDDIIIRRAESRDCAQLAEMLHCLWPESSVDEHAAELATLLQSEIPGNLRAVILLAHHPDDGIVGFIEAGLRSHADGCDASHPVGYVEGWYVAPAYRRRKIAARLLAAAEEWSRNEGCREMASDTWTDNLDSQRVHEALGFEVVDRCVHYRKQL
jgi:aminoglycoside 6'-N-acetyltransferase I